LVVLHLVVSTSASDYLERLVSKMTYSMLMGTLNHTHSLAHTSAIVTAGTPMMCKSFASRLSPISSTNSLTLSYSQAGCTSRHQSCSFKAL